MNNILDNIQEIKKLDSKNMLGSLESLFLQIKQLEPLFTKFKLPTNYKKVKKIVFCGMGGSTLGSHIIKSLFFKELKIQAEIINDYHIPAWVDKNTIAIITSYSGTTEEPVGAMQEAKKKGAKIAVVTSGGVLEREAKKNHWPAVVFSTENNPCNSPRMGGGYMLFGQLLILARAGLVKFSLKDWKSAEKILKESGDKFGVENLSTNNPAKQLAQKLFGKNIFYAAAEHLLGNAHVGANQINENAKRFATFFSIPELNHHLMEGMIYPESNPTNLVFLLLESHLYDLRIQKRFAVTKAVLDKNKICHESYVCSEKTRLGQVMEILALTGHVSYYSAILQGIDPTAIPFVDFFKAELKK